MRATALTTKTNDMQGFHECEVFDKRPDVLECYKRRDACQKNHKHNMFVSVKNLTENQSLNDYQRKLLREFLDRVVRISVDWTSQARPQTDPFADDRGTRQYRGGTGFVSYVSKCRVDIPCPCDVCKGERTTPHWKFHVRTARHVVFNSEEAKETIINLFYDDDDALLCGKVKTVWGLKLEKEHPDPSLDLDESVVVCVTHDEALAKRIQSNNLSHWSSLPDLSLQYYPNNHGLMECLQPKLTKSVRGQAHAVIFSHPHLLPKMLSVGKWNPRKVEAGNSSHIEYETATCAGCSGAPVVLLHAGSDLFDSQYFPWEGSVHCGTYTEKPKKPSDQKNFSKDSKHTYPVIEL